MSELNVLCLCRCGLRVAVAILVLRIAANDIDVSPRMVLLEADLQSPSCEVQPLCADALGCALFPLTGRFMLRFRDFKVLI